MTSPIPQEILTELGKCSKPESCARIVFFLAQHAANGTAEPYIQSLQAYIHMPKIFEKVLERMEQDTLLAEKNEIFMQVVHDVHQNFMKESLDKKPLSCQSNPLSCQCGDLAVPKVSASISSIDAVVVHNFMRAVREMPPENYIALSRVIQAIGEKSSVVGCGGKALNMVRSAKPMVRVLLVKACLVYDITMNIRRWWKGEISGKRCVKNIISYGVSIAAGIAGGIGGEVIGAAIGIALGPVGSACGAIVGSIAGGLYASRAAQDLADDLLEWMFGLPKTEALENAYNFFGLPADASNSDINTRYRQLALKHHPDKGGNREKWTKLQYSLAIIREARDEY